MSKHISFPSKHECGLRIHWLTQPSPLLCKCLPTYVRILMCMYMCILVCVYTCTYGVYIQYVYLCVLCVNKPAPNRRGDSIVLDSHRQFTGLCYPSEWRGCSPSPCPSPCSHPWYTHSVTWTALFSWHSWNGCRSNIPSNMTTPTVQYIRTYVHDI